MFWFLSLWNNTFKASQRAGKWGIIFFPFSCLSSSRKRDSQMWWRQRKGTRTASLKISWVICAVLSEHKPPHSVLHIHWACLKLKMEFHLGSSSRLCPTYCLTDISLALALVGTDVLWRNSAWLGSPFVMATLSSFDVKKFRLWEPAAVAHWLRGAFSSHKAKHRLLFSTEPYWALCPDLRTEDTGTFKCSRQQWGSQGPTERAACRLQIPAERGCLKYQKLHTCGWFPYRDWEQE